ncbi:MAG: hypothetical protein V3W41_17960 [Planctomycetota bacterium]
MSTKLPSEAVDYYLSLGAERSYIAVARLFEVSKRTVSRRAAEEDWQSRVEELERPDREQAFEQKKAQQAVEVTRVNGLQDAFREVITPQRMKALVATMFKNAVQKDDVRAARFLIERSLGRARNEPLSPVSLDLPNGLETTTDIRRAANSLLQSIADGSLAPEDAQKAAMVLEAVRTSIETEDLEKRLIELEEQLKRQDKP